MSMIMLVIMAMMILMMTMMDSKVGCVTKKNAAERLGSSDRRATCEISQWNLSSYEAVHGPNARIVLQSPENKAFREGTTEPHTSPMYPHELFKVQFWRTWAQILGVKRRPWPQRLVSLTIGKLMIPWFEHDACNEIAMQSIGAPKNGLWAGMWLK